MNFSYRRIRYFGVDLGLFEVPVDRSITVMARRNFGNLRKGVIYTRRNAQNAEADAHEIQRITDWYRELEQPPTAKGTSQSSWESFYRACDEFDDSRMFVAVLGDDHAFDSDDCEGFAGVGWQVVVDFDQNAEVNGIYSLVSPSLSKRKSLRIDALVDPVSHNLSPAASV